MSKRFRPTTVCSSDGTSLQFEETDEDLYETYQELQTVIDDLLYKKLRKRNGIWASNQGKYVESPDQLNEWDSKVMENRYTEKQL